MTDRRKHLVCLRLLIAILGGEDWLIRAYEREKAAQQGIEGYN